MLSFKVVVLLIIFLKEILVKYMLDMEVLRLSLRVVCLNVWKKKEYIKINGDIFLKLDDFCI